MEYFYSNILGFEKVEKQDRSVSYKLGESFLVFEQQPKSTPYHFALNIPSNQVLEALEWLKQRVEILCDGVNEIQDFKDWNAKAIYFYDPDDNIVEFIARKNLNLNSEKPFSASSVLEISEIGMPVDDIGETYDRLSEIVRLPQYDGGMERFCAIGDEHGLFICINKRVKDWFPTGDKAHSSAFYIEFVVRKTAYKLSFLNGAIV